MTLILQNLETCAHVDIKILRDKFKHWLQIGQAIIVHTLKMVYTNVHVKRIFFSFNFEILDVKLVKA